MNVIVCVKRVPLVGARITLTADEQEIDARFLGFGFSPHEECAIEEAIRITSAHGGQSTVLTLGSEEAQEQLRTAMAMGVDEAILLETDGRPWEPQPTAREIVRALRGRPFDLLLFGNESADSGGYQVGVRVAHALGLPIVTGVKSLEFENGQAIARREAGQGWEIFQVALPAVFSVKEGINLPRYPSVPGRLRARRKEIERLVPEPGGGGLARTRLKIPPASNVQVQLLGHGPDAAAAVVDLMAELEVLP